MQVTKNDLKWAEAKKGKEAADTAISRKSVDSIRTLFLFCFSVGFFCVSFLLILGSLSKGDKDSQEPQAYILPM